MGYHPNHSAAVGIQIGQLTGMINDRGKTPGLAGHSDRRRPQYLGGDCSASGHSAAWTATLTNSNGSFSFPIFVDALIGQPTELHWCLSKSAPQLNTLMFNLSGVSRARPTASPSGGRFTPYDPATGNVIDGEQVSALTEVRLPQLVTLHASFSRRTQRYVVAGSVTENGKPVRARVLLF